MYFIQGLFSVPYAPMAILYHLRVKSWKCLTSQVTDKYSTAGGDTGEFCGPN